MVGMPQRTAGQQPEPPERIEHRTSVAESRQLARIITRQIERGTLTRGMRIPSLKDLAETYEIAPVTAAKAIRHLKDEGLVYTVPSLGTFVGPPPDDD
jgi:DNA-binding GntR family transcriptional regulator